MKTKSMIAGEYTAPPAHGPMTAEICGTTPEARVLRRKMSAYPASETTPSWIRAPPESLSPMIGTPVFIARSITLRSEEHTSELQSLAYLVCRLLLEKKKKINTAYYKCDRQQSSIRVCKDRSSV